LTTAPGSRPLPGVARPTREIQLGGPNACSHPTTNTRSGSRPESNRCLPRTPDRVTVREGVSEGVATPAGPVRARSNVGGRAMTALTARQRQVLEFIDAEVRGRGYPPSVREIGEAVGLSSSSTVHAHLAALQDKGYLVRDPTKPRAIEVRFEPGSGAAVERPPVRNIPLLRDVAARARVLAAQNGEEPLPPPPRLPRPGPLFP